MDDFGRNDNYGVKLVVGVLVGIIVLLFLVPLAANIVAKGVVDSPANDAINSIDNSYNTLIVDIPINVYEFNFVGFENIGIIESNEIYQYVNITNISNSNNTNNQTEINSSNPVEEDNLVNNQTGTDDELDESESTSGTEGLTILSGSISTGSELEDKSYCEVYVGNQYSGENVLISTLYSRDGTDLNSGNKVSVTVDSSGYIGVNAADSFSEYPSNCIITIYDTNGNVLDSRSVSLATESGTQNF